MTLHALPDRPAPGALSIHALHVGDIVDWPTPALLHMRGWTETRDLPLIMFVILGASSPVVVDTGGGTPAYVAEKHGYRIRQSSDQLPEAALMALGVDPREVQVVVNSHLHWDHSSNNHLFPNARIVVQRAELEYAISPAPVHAKPYEQLAGSVPHWLSEESRFDVVEGDVPLERGVSVVHLPGHSPGSQGVLVESAGKRFLIAGDCVGSYENWSGDAHVDHIPSGSFTSLIDYTSSFERIEALDCIVIPSHDPAVVATNTFS